MPPTAPQNTPQAPQVRIENKHHAGGGAGPIVGIVIVVILFVFGALYFWGQQLNKQAAPDAVIEARLNV